MKQCNPQCRENWIYTTRYSPFPSFRFSPPSLCRCHIRNLDSHIPRSFLSLFPMPPPISRVFAYFIIRPRQADERCVTPLARISTSLDIYLEWHSSRMSKVATSLPFNFFKIIFFPSSPSTILFSLSLNLFFCTLAFFQSYTLLCIYSLRII